MGIIFRNGIPFGATDSKDVTIVANYADLANLTVKQSDHIYIVENATDSTSPLVPKIHQSYYYDENEEVFKPIATINGNSDAILVASGASGNPANWGVANSATFYAKTTITNGTTPDASTEFTIGADAPSNVYPAAFGHIAASITNPATMPTLSDGYITRDKAIQKIAGAAKINIGEDNADYSSQNKKFWDRSLSGPEIDIGGTAIIEMNGTGDGNSTSDTPVVSMRGRCLIDMCGSRSVTPSTDGPYNRKTTMKWWPNALGGENAGSSSSPDPFWPTRSIAESTETFPLLKMHDSSTISMEGAPIFQMRGNSLLNINGKVAIDINGVDGIGPDGIDNRGSQPVGIDIRPGTFIQMGVGNASLPPSKTLFKMTENQIVACCALPGGVDLKLIGNNTFTTDSGHGYGYPNASNDYFPFRETALRNNAQPFVFVGADVMAKWDPTVDNNRIGSWKTSGYWGSDPTIYTQGPALTVQGKTRMVIGDGGTTAMMIGGQGNLSLKLMPETMSSLEISLGSTGGADVINIANGGAGYNVFNHCAAEGANTKYDFTPSGDTFFKFGPKTKFYANLSPKETEMMFQWDTFYGFFQGENNYALLDGKQTHIENVGNTFIMNDDTTIRTSLDNSEFSSVYYRKDSNDEIVTTIFDSAELPASCEEFLETQEAQDALIAFNSIKSTLPEADKINNAKPALHLSSYLDYKGNDLYDQNKDRLWTVTYPTDFYIYRKNTINFTSETAMGQQTTSYTKVTSAFYSNADLIAAVKNNIGEELSALFQGFNNVTSGTYAMEYRRTGSGPYFYTIRNIYVRLRDTFGVPIIYDTQPNAPASGLSYDITQEYSGPGKVANERYNSSTLPSGWVLAYNRNYANAQTYTSGSAIDEHKNARVISINYSIAPKNYESFDKSFVQVDDSGDTKPVFQMYDRSNFMMRADTIFKPFYNEYVQRPLTTLETYEFTPTDTYTGLTTETIVVHTTTSYGYMNYFLMSEDYRTFVEAVETQYPGDTVAGVISWSKASAPGGGYNNTIVFVLASVRRACELEVATFINSADYAAFTTHLTTEYPSKELWRIAYLQAGEDNKFIVYFGLKDAGETEFLKDPSGDEPIFEMVGKSQLRMYNGAYIKGESKNGETTFTFGSNRSSEEPISFTLTELKALKDLIVNPPTPLAPAESQSF